MRGNVLHNRAKEYLNLLIAGTLPKPIRSRFPFDDAILDREPQHFGKARFSGAEEPRHPDGDTFVRLVAGFAVCLKYMCIVIANRRRKDVLVYLLTDNRFLRLVDLDDFLDAAANVVGKERPDGLI